MPISSTQRAILAGLSSILIPSVSTTSAEPHSDDMDRLPCLATLSPAPATTKAVAVDTLKVPEASPPVPAVSISISRSVPVAPTSSLPPVRTLTTFWRMTWAKPISSSTVSPFIRRAVRKAAICASVAAPDMIASMAAAASMRERSFRSTSARMASVMMGLVTATSAPARPRGRMEDAASRTSPILMGLASTDAHPARLQLFRRHLDREAAHEYHGQAGDGGAHGARQLPAGHAGHGEIGEDEVERLTLHVLEPLVGVPRHHHVVPRRPEHVGQHVAHALLVVHDHAAQGHRLRQLFRVRNRSLRYRADGEEHDEGRALTFLALHRDGRLVT